MDKKYWNRRRTLIFLGSGLVLFLAIFFLYRSNQTSVQVSSILFSEEKVDYPQELFEQDATFLYKTSKWDQLEESLRKAKLEIEAKEKENVDQTEYKQVHLFYRGLLAMHQQDTKTLETEILPAITNKGIQSMLRGHAQLLKNQLDQALQSYQLAYDELQDPELLTNMADVYVQKAQWSQAERFYQKALQAKNGINADWEWYSLGKVYLTQGKKRLAEKVWSFLVEKNPRNNGLQEELIALYKDLGEDRKAMMQSMQNLLIQKNFTEIVNQVEQAPEWKKDIEIFKFYLMALVQMGNRSKAGFELQTQSELNRAYKQDLDLNVYYAILIERDRDPKMFLTYMKTMYEKFPQHFFIASTYVEELERQEGKKTKEVRDIYQQILNIEPDNLEYRDKLAAYYQEKGDTTLAQLYYGILFFYENDIVRAREYLERLQKEGSLVSKEGEHELYWYLGKLAFSEGNSEKSMTYLDKAYAIVPEKRILLDKAYQYAQLGKEKEAKETLASFLEQDRVTQIWSQWNESLLLKQIA